MTRLRKWTPVLVEWSDAHGGDEGWRQLDPRHSAPATIRTVGMLGSDNRKGLCVVLSVDQSTKDFGAYVFIPKQNVISVTELQAKETE